MSFWHTFGHAAGIIGVLQQVPMMHTSMHLAFWLLKLAAQVVKKFFTDVLVCACACEVMPKPSQACMLNSSTWLIHSWCSQASTLSDSGHLSALAATNITHAERVDWSHCHNPSFRTTNQKYGQRLPLEQVYMLTVYNTQPMLRQAMLSRAAFGHSMLI